MKASRRQHVVIACAVTVQLAAITEAGLLLFGVTVSAWTAYIWLFCVFGLAAIVTSQARQLHGRLSTLEDWGTTLDYRSKVLEDFRQELLYREQAVLWGEGEEVMARTAEQLMGNPLELAGNRALFRSLRRDLDAAGRSPATVAAYNQGCRSLEQWLISHGRDGDLAAAGRDDLTGWLTWLQQPRPAGGGYAKDSVVSYFRSVRRFYNFLVDDEVIERSPLLKIPEPRESGKPMEVPALDTVRALIATCKPAGSKPGFRDLRDEMIIRIFCETGGPRCGEVAGLPLDGIDLGTDLIQICGKGGKWRTIALSAKTAKAADKYLRARRAHPYAHVDRLVIGEAGPMGASGIWQMIQRRSRAAGVKPVHPHQFRHMAADRAKSAGMSDGDMMRLFGWTSNTMLDRYGAVHADRRAIEAARKLSLGNEL